MKATEGANFQGAWLWRVLSWGLGLLIGGCGRSAGKDHRDITFDVSPTGHQLVFTAAGEGERDLYLLDLTTQRVTQIAQTPEYEQDPAFSPDGKSIVCAASASVGQPARIFVRSLDGDLPRQLTSGERFSDSEPSFSPDGSHITFARAHRHRPYSMGGYVWDDWDVYLIRADGTDLRRVTHQNYYQLWRPQLSRDRTAIVFGVFDAEHGNLFKVPGSGDQAPSPLTADNHSYSPGLSGDGKQIVFLSDRAKAFNPDLYLMDANGTNLKRLTDNRSYNVHPVVASDGQRVLFLSKVGERAATRYSLWEVETSSLRLNQIADPSLFDAPLEWRPQDRG